MKHPKKSLKYLKMLPALFIFVMPALTGCAGESGRMEFPINHPANPAALETEFVPPQNPFKTDVAIKEGKPETDSMMKHKTPAESGKMHQEHNQ